MRYIALSYFLLLFGCFSSESMVESKIFYQAYDPARQDSVAPFFLTLDEAQKFANNMNRDKSNNYRVSFITP